MAHSISKKASRRLSYLTKIIARDGGVCVWCSTPLQAEDKTATIEHLIPLSCGGENVFQNMVLACASCNHHRQSTVAETWLAECKRQGLLSQPKIIFSALQRVSVI